MFYLTLLFQDIEQSDSTLLAMAIGAVLTLTGFIVSWILNNKSFKNEYYKKLIEKRFNAYIEIETILLNMQETIQFNDSEVFSFFLDKGSFKEFHAKVMSSNVSAWWLNQDMVNLIYTFNDFLWKEIHFKSDEAVMLELGEKHHKELKRYYYDIRNLLFNDLKNLHKVEKFIKDKSENPSYEDR